MNGLGFNQIEAAFDPLNPLFDTIKTAVDARQSFFDMRRPHLQVLDIADQQIDPLFHSRQSRLDLLEQRQHELSDFAHAGQHICSCDVPQAAKEMH